MTPQQREAALRLMERWKTAASTGLDPSPFDTLQWDSFAFLQELAQEPQAEPVAWNVCSVNSAWGRDDLMAIAAMRYCLGRMTYITSDCSEWLLAQWPHIRPRARAVIQRDIDEAFARDDEAREAGDSYKPLGWDCDRDVWQKVRELWAPNVADKRRAGGPSA